jgi:hypothetical protein
VAALLAHINASYRQDDAFFVTQQRTTAASLADMAREGVFYVGFELRADAVAAAAAAGQQAGLGSAPYPAALVAPQVLVAAAAASGQAAGSAAAAALAASLRAESLAGDNAYACEACGARGKGKQPATLWGQLATLPPVLHLQLLCPAQCRCFPP